MGARRGSDGIDTGEKSVETRSGTSDPAVGHTGKTPEHRFARGAEIERNAGALYGLGVDRALGDLVVLAREIDAILRPEVAHYFHAFDQAAHSFLHWDADAPVLRLGAADRKSESEPAAAEVVEAGGC